jgi:hypothetical protein
MKKYLCGVVAALLLTSSGGVYAEETLTLTTPETKPPVTQWKIQQLTIALFPNQSVTLTLYDPNVPSYTQTCVADETTTPSAKQVISSINTANMTNNSLSKRAKSWAQSTGCLGAGTISGIPE